MINILNKFFNTSNKVNPVKSISSCPSFKPIKIKTRIEKITVNGEEYFYAQINRSVLNKYFPDFGWESIAYFEGELMITDNKYTKEIHRLIGHPKIRTEYFGFRNKEDAEKALNQFLNKHSPSTITKEVVYQSE